MVFNGADSDQFSEIAPQRAKTATWAKGLNRYFGAETALLNLQCMSSSLGIVFFFNRATKDFIRTGTHL